MLPLTLVLSGCTAVYSAKPASGLPAAVYVHGHKDTQMPHLLAMNFNGLYIRQRVDKNNEQHWLLNDKFMKDSYYASLDCHRGKVYDYKRKATDGKWTHEEKDGYIPKYYIRKTIPFKSENECWNVWYTIKNYHTLERGDGHYGVYADAIATLLKQSDGSIPIRNVTDVCKLETMVSLEVIQKWCKKLENERNGVRDEILEILQRYLLQKQCLLEKPDVKLAGDHLMMRQKMKFGYTGFNEMELKRIDYIIKREVKKITDPASITGLLKDRKMDEIKQTVREELSAHPWNCQIGLQYSNKPTKYIEVSFRR